MRISYITATAPFEKGETFVNIEMLELKKQNVELIIIPRDFGKVLFHKEAKGLIKNTINLPVFSFKYFKNLGLSNKNVNLILELIVATKNPKMILKNLFVAPKAFFLASLLKQKQIDHIHVHWGSTTATIGYIISKLTNIPWSFTLHRWDIYENNMLLEKTKTASFVRCISKKGRNDLIKIIKTNDYNNKITVIHVAVDLENVQLDNERRNLKSENELFLIAVPANLQPVKGHIYLINAVELLVKQRITNFTIFFFGDGYLKNDLLKQIDSKGLKNYFKLCGMISHDELMKKYRLGLFDIVVLPSVNTSLNEHEGIPVALIEAMSFGIPVISTRTGSIDELVTEGAGFLVSEKNSVELSNALKNIMKSESSLRKIGLKGIEIITKDFNVRHVVQVILNKIIKLSDCHETSKKHEN